MLKQTDWEKFLRRSLLNANEYPPFVEVIAVLREFLWPVVAVAVAVAVDNLPFEDIWKKGGPWVSTHNDHTIAP